MKLAFVLALAAPVLANCPDVVSCSPQAAGVDPCCVPDPGLFVFRQRFEPDTGGDFGSWGIDGIDVLACDGSGPTHAVAAPKRAHEEIGSLCHRSPLFDFEEAEREWAQSEVGEGVEELWERSWNTAGRYVSTLCDGDVARFFYMLHELHSSFPTASLLAEADITPSPDTTYSLNELSTALAFDGHQPIVTCDNLTLSTIEWPLHVRGPLESFIPTSLDRTSNCPAEGIIYPSSTTRPRPTTTHTWDPIYRPSPRPITLSHDEAKQVPYEKLGFFKGADEGREAGKGKHSDEKKYGRDEL